MSLREQIKKALQAHRCSWVELGRLLNEVVYGGDYKEWGFDDFEIYCARELGLKKITVQKLMISYNYMRKHQHNKLNDLETGKDILLPSHETVALLDKVERSEEVSEEELNVMKAMAFSNTVHDGGYTEFKKHASQFTPRRQIDPDKAEKAAILKTSRKLRRVMAASHFVPDGLKERIEEPLVELEALG